MKAVRIAGAALVTVALSFCLTLSGLGACLLPPVTRALAGAVADDELSPFTREQLARVADAVRDYSFGTHDELSLQQVVYEVNVEYRDAARVEGATLPAGFPRLDVVSDPSNLDQLREAFVHASERWYLTADAISHLDDCHTVLKSMLPWLGVALVIVVVGLAYARKTGGPHAVGLLLLVSGALVVSGFAALGLWALVSFDGLFTAFHQLFFSQGNWQFSYDSLLICSLPTEFWMGMGAVWLLVSLAVSLACLGVGRHLRHA